MDLNILKPIVVLEEVISKVNGRITVKKSWGLGIYLEVNGLTQSGGILNAIWKSTFRVLKRRKSVVGSCLILGMGGGSAAIVLRKYFPGVDVVGVDIDPTMVGLGKKYLGSGWAKTIIKDAFRYLTTCRHGYDLIIVDLYLGDIGPKRFDSKIFISLIKKHLNLHGVVVFNRLYYGEKRREAVKFGKKLEKLFGKIEYYYPEANLMLICSDR